MKETVLTSARVAYEPPYADIIEFAVEKGFQVTGGGSTNNYNPTNGIEGLGREEEDSWHS